MTTREFEIEVFQSRDGWWWTIVDNKRLDRGPFFTRKQAERVGKRWCRKQARRWARAVGNKFTYKVEVPE